MAMLDYLIKMWRIKDKTTKEAEVNQEKMNREKKQPEPKPKPNDKVPSPGPKRP